MAEAMSPHLDFHAQLELALEKRGAHFSNTLLPALKREYSNLHTSFKTLFGILVQKGLVREDPYKYDRKISEITIPSTEPIGETEQSDEIGLRLSQCETQLDFLENSYQFSLEFLTLKRIRLLADLAKYIDWDHLVETTTKANTRAVAILCGKIRSGSDTLSSKLILDTQRQMAESVGKIMETLKELADYHRESYKLNLRRDVLPRAQISATLANQDVDAAVARVRKAFGSATDGSLPFYQDLVREVIIEDFTAAGEKEQRAVLAKLAIKPKKQKRRVREPLKPILLEGVRILATASRHLESAVKKLEANAEYYENHHVKTGWLRRLLERLVQNEKRARIYAIEFVDVATSVSRQEKVNFDEFLASATKLAKGLAGFASKHGDRHTHLEQTEEQVIYETLEKMIVEVQLKVRMLPGLQEFFVAELPREDRDKLQGVRLETTAIQNALVKSNQRRHDYVARKDEEEQLKKLGFESDQVPSE